MTNDEQRLLSFFRALPPADQNELLRLAGTKAVDRCIPGCSVQDFLLPIIDGIDPYDRANGIAEIFDAALNALGEPDEVALGSEHWDESEFVPRFAAAATSAASRQGSFFNYDKNFARKFLMKWRWQIAEHCESVASKTIG